MSTPPTLTLNSKAAPASPDAGGADAGKLLGAVLKEQWARTDRALFGVLLGLWAVAGTAAAYFELVNFANLPTSDWLALALAAIPVPILAVFVWLRPGAVLTRRFMAVGWIYFSTMLAHLGSGRVDLSFAIFFSLVLLAFYLDLAQLLFAAVLAAGDGALHALVWPDGDSSWHWVEQGAWIFLGAIVLGRLVRQNLSTSRQHLAAQALLAEYATAQENLSKQVAEREEKALKLDVLNKEIIASSREAGMAEIATSVLHNVGNILNSVNTSGSIICDRARRSKAGELGKVTALIRKSQSEGKLAEFLTSDPRGRMIPQLLEHFADALLLEQGELIAEAEGLSKNIAHIRDIVAMQQTYASVSGLREQVSLAVMLNDAVQINEADLEKVGVEIVREFRELPSLMVDKSKLMQILVNLIKNAWQSIEEQGPEKKVLTLGLTTESEGMVCITIRDNGVGIPFENLTRIFSHGFTTKRNGHGFGLHGGSLLAKEMGGSLTAQSHGPGRGATFTLKLPATENAPAPAAAS